MDQCKPKPTNGPYFLASNTLVWVIPQQFSKGVGAFLVALVAFLPRNGWLSCYMGNIWKICGLYRVTQKSTPY